MKKLLFFSLPLFLLPFTLPGQDVPVPEGYELIDSLRGDLNKDGLPELVVVYNISPDSIPDSVEKDRRLCIYRQTGDRWELWKESESVILGSMEGGVFGDPYAGIEIKKGILWINHYGGSSWRWGYTDKYRYQDGEFYLIGYTSSYGHFCQYEDELDFNLSTGKMYARRTHYSCAEEDRETTKVEKETLYKKGLKITIQDRDRDSILIGRTKYGQELYL